MDIAYDSTTGIASFRDKADKIISNDGSLTAAKILIPGVDAEAEDVNGNFEAAMRLVLLQIPAHLKTMVFTIIPQRILQSQKQVRIET